MGVYLKPKRRLERQKRQTIHENHQRQPSYYHHSDGRFWQNARGTGDWINMEIDSAQLHFIPISYQKWDDEAAVDV